jgi:hypothetical protein
MVEAQGSISGSCNRLLSVLQLCGSPNLLRKGDRRLFPVAKRPGREAVPMPRYRTVVLHLHSPTRLYGRVLN